MLNTQESYSIVDIYYPHLNGAHYTKVMFIIQECLAVLMFETLRENLDQLEKAGLLRRISQPINKDREMMPLVRCQFRGLEEKKRKAWLFEHPVDDRGREYTIPVSVASVAPSRRVYRFNLEVESDKEIFEKWENALENPIEPETTSNSAIKEVILQGNDLEGPRNGADRLPIPISTPGFDPAPYLTSAFVITSDPDTGELNMGTYRCQFINSNTFRVTPFPGQDARVHWEKASSQGLELECAVVIGAPPHIPMVSVSKIPYNTNEFSVAGGLIGKPIRLIEGETIDLQIPTCAEIAIEGTLTTETFEEGPFGEYTGYLGGKTESPNLAVTCITHREDPIYQAFVSQIPPSESTVIRKVGNEQNLLHHLRNTSLTGVEDVALHESSGSLNFLVLQIDRNNVGEAWQALYAAMGYKHQGQKFTIVVDNDINPHDLQSVIWAISFRVQPERDIRIVPGRRSQLDPVSAPPDVPLDDRAFPEPTGDSAVIIDATRPWDYRPISLPKKTYMNKALELWEEIGLPDLSLVEPWYGESLGYWSEELDNKANAAVKGDYYME